MQRNEEKYLEAQGVPVPPCVYPRDTGVQSTVIVSGGPLPQPVYPPVKHRGIIDTYLLSLPPLGWLGIHHFYLGRYGFGLVYFFTLGLLGVGWLVDLFRMPCLVKRANFKFNNPKVPEDKSLCDAYVLWFPLGLLGFHHFYLHRWIWGIAYFFSFGFLGIGWIIDGVRMKWLVESYNEDQRTSSTDPQPRPHEKKLGDAYVLTLCPITALLGFPHYYLERYGFGVMYTLTLGFFGVGFIVDVIRMPMLVKRTNKTREHGSGLYNRAHYDDAYLLLFPLGFLGFHHFYLRRYIWGVLYFFTFGLLGIGWIIDFFRLPCLIKEYNLEVERRQATHGNVVVQVPSTTGVDNPALVVSQTNAGGYGTNFNGGFSPAQLPPYQPYPQQYPSQVGGPAVPYMYPQGYQPYPANGPDSATTISTIPSSNGDQPPSYMQATDESAQNSFNESIPSAPPVFDKH